MKWTPAGSMGMLVVAQAVAMEVEVAVAKVGEVMGCRA